MRSSRTRDGGGIADGGAPVPRDGGGVGEVGERGPGRRLVVGGWRGGKGLGFSILIPLSRRAAAAANIVMGKCTTTERETRRGGQETLPAEREGLEICPHRQIAETRRG